MMTDIIEPLVLSFQVAGAATVGVAAVGVPLAYALARGTFRGREALDVAVTLPMVLPPVVTGYYLLGLIGRNGVLGTVTERLTGTPYGLTFTWQAAVLAAFAVSLPLAVKTARSAIESVDPSLAHASWVLGRGRAATAVLVELPLAWRGVLAGLTIAFARALGEFGATVMVAGNIPGRTTTMPLELYNRVVLGDWRAATVLVALFTTVSAAVLLTAGRLSRVRAW